MRLPSAAPPQRHPRPPEDVRLTRRLLRVWGRYGLYVSLAAAACVWVGGTLVSHGVLVQTTAQQARVHRRREARLVLPFQNMPRLQNNSTVLHPPDELAAADSFQHGWRLPDAFYDVLVRAKTMRRDCASLSSRPLDASVETLVGNESFASLPSMGIVQALQAWQTTDEHPEADAMLIDVEDSALNWQCQLPPETECAETQLTVIFMAYNPDRLENLLKQTQVFLTDPQWQTLVAEVVLVWNGPRPIEESADGQKLLALSQHLAFRVVYPLRRGLENDLMNRYHPTVVKVEQTKAILYYDDDGPFYSFAAVQAGFELWKRHARAQMGAMSRNFIDSARQKTELQSLLALPTSTPRDKLFVSHCTNMDDFVEYDYHYFANYDAHMVLPSGSMLHANYLCFLWHPVLEPIREFVRAHPVHPDDATVSMIVSQLAGRAPRTYSRRLNRPSEEDVAKYQNVLRQQGNLRAAEGGRRLSATERDAFETELERYQGLIPLSELQRRRSLMFNFDWDAKHGNSKEAAEFKAYWAALRTNAINSIVRYFGSISGGSTGWCENTPFYHEKTSGRCRPEMAKIGWLPWMEADGSPKQSCP